MREYGAIKLIIEKMTTTANSLPGVPDVESPLFEPIFREKQVSPGTMEIARKLRQDGYAVLDFPDPAFPDLAAHIIKTLNPQYDWDGWRSGRIAGLRVQDAWKTIPEVLRIAANQQLITLLSDIYGRRAFPFQTLNFPVGTQQHFHSDSVHFSSHPERFMCGVWVALEDVDSENGPLVYYPGSHRLPVFTNEHIGANPNLVGGKPFDHYPRYERAWEAIVEAEGLKPVQYHAKKGQALIWAANLLHGGAAQKNMSRTRYSQVTHYYFEGCSYYTPLASVPFLGPVLFRDIVDISTGLPVPNVLNGIEIPRSHIEYTAQATQVLKPLDTPPGFDPYAYLLANPDVAAADIDPALHWLEFGYREGRPLR